MLIEYLELILKCIFFYLVIIIALRFMGKREVGELSVLDIVIYFVMSELLALSISSKDESIFKALIPILTLSILQIGIAWILLKKKKWRDIFEGRPCVLIRNGVINQNEMKKQRYTLDDLMYQLRDKEVSSPDEVEFAVLENSGILTVLKKEHCKVKWVDPLVSDGVIQKKILNHLNKSEEWLIELLKKEGIDDPSLVFLCLWQKNGLFVIKKTL